MKQFMAGDIGPGEMGCGIELMVLLTNTDHENTKYNTNIQIVNSNKQASKSFQLLFKYLD